jgi:hypothetical protein
MRKNDKKNKSDRQVLKRNIEANERKGKEKV